MMAKVVLSGMVAFETLLTAHVETYGGGCTARAYEGVEGSVIQRCCE
jgi:hypothetical protein